MRKNLDFLSKMTKIQIIEQTETEFFGEFELNGTKFQLSADIDISYTWADIKHVEVANIRFYTDENTTIIDYVPIILTEDIQYLYAGFSTKYEEDSDNFHEDEIHDPRNHNDTFYL